MVASATDAARLIVDERTTIRPTAPEQVAFVAALLSPPAANDRLERAAKNYRNAASPGKGGREQH